MFPSACALCHEPLEEAGTLDVCAACWAGLAPWTGPACPRCGLPFASDVALDAAKPFCAECRSGEHPFDAARSFGVYRDQLRRAILHLKFRPRERWGKRLGGLLAQTWESNGEIFGAEAAAIIPVPLHPDRRRERGYNQAEALARGLVAALARKQHRHRLDTRCLVKTLATQPQTGLSWAQRRDNVSGAFAVPDPGSVKDRSLVLVDDVMTTGATLSACAAALKAAGARRVVAITLARASPQFPDIDSGEAPAGLGGGSV